jgi:hypothetical protein
LNLDRDNRRMAERLRVWEFEGAELDLLVAQACGIKDARIVGGVCLRSDGHPFQPSSNWFDGGPIVEQAQISLWRYPDLDSWHACTQFDFVRDEGLKTTHYCQGPTPLIAAMRSFAASQFWVDPQQ